MVVRSNLMIKGVTKHAFSLLRDVYGLSDEDIDGLDSAALTERVRRIHEGFSAEHEFAAIASWLGRCSLVSQIDDVLHTSRIYRAPDFLVVARYKGREIPFLVEVKSTDDDALEWTGNYMESLRAFAALMNLPLLVAWKRGRLWTLSDCRLFAQKVAAHHLPLDLAIQNSLMSLLFGNVWIKFRGEFRLELTLRIQDQVDFTTEILPEGTYTFTIEDAGIWANKGRLTTAQSKELWWFLVTAASETSFDHVHDVATQRFSADAESTFNLSDVLLAQLFWDKGEEQNIDWLVEIRKGLPSAGVDLHEILQHALDVGAVRYVFEQVPELTPDFLN
jgi:hypothetical protein